MNHPHSAAIVSPISPSFPQGSVKAHELKEDLDQVQSPSTNSASLENFRRSVEVKEMHHSPPPCPSGLSYRPSTNVVKTAAVTGKLEVRCVPRAEGRGETNMGR